MKHVYKVGELASLYGISTDTVRYYEEQGLISPHRAENGYRMYSIRDIWRMNVIRDLRGLGFSVERIGAYLKGRSVDSTLRLLEEERGAILESMARLEALLGNVEERIDTLRQAEKMPLGVVEETAFPERRAYVIRERFSTDEEVDVLMKKLLNLDPRRSYLIGSNNIGCRIPLEAVRAGAYRRYDAVFLMDRAGETVIGEGRYLRLRYRGDSRQTARYIPVMADYAAGRGLRFAGDVLELIWIDIHEAEDVREHITELQICVETERA